MTLARLFTLARLAMRWAPVVIALTISMCLAAAVGFVGDRLARDHTIEAVWHDGERTDTTFTRGTWIPTPDDRHIIAFVGELHCHGLAVHFVGTPRQADRALARLCAK